MMKLRLAQPELLIDLGDLEDLTYIRHEGDEIRIGAMTRHVDLLRSELLAEHFPVFAEAEEVIADPAVRNRGTLGGSLCQADPGEDLSAVVTALKGTVVLRSADGERVIGMDEFHVGPYMTAVRSAEILTEIRFPVRPGAGSAHEKVERRAGDYAIAAVSAALWIDGGTIIDSGIALAAVGPFAIDAKRAQESLSGKPVTDELFAQAGQIAAEESSPGSDSRGPAEYKRHLVGVLTKRALRKAAARALHQEA
jgi:carbon-monoxide dehydrogenase medium subunit